VENVDKTLEVRWKKYSTFSLNTDNAVACCCLLLSSCSLNQQPTLDQQLHHQLACLSRPSLHTYAYLFLSYTPITMPRVALLLACLIAVVAVANSSLVISPTPNTTVAVEDAYIGYAGQLSISFTNPTADDLSISSAVFSEPNSDTVQWSMTFPYGQTISPNETITLQVSASSTVAQTINNTLTVTTTDADNALIWYNLTSTVVTNPPVLYANPAYSTLYFGDGAPDSHHSVSILFRNDYTSNTDTVPLTLNPQILGSDAASFSITPPNAKLSSNATVTFTVSCSTSSYGTLLADLQFTTNDPNNVAYTYQLSCWSVHMARDVSVGFLVLFVFWFIMAALTWATFAFKQ
jgi:hypothetical protein